MDIDAKISSKTEHFGNYVCANRLAESIRDLFLMQVQDLILKLKAYLLLMEKDGRFQDKKKIEKWSKNAGGTFGAVLGVAIAGGVGANIGSKIGSNLGSKVGGGVDKINHLTVGDFEVPKCVLPNLTLTPERHVQEIKTTFGDEIHILEGFLKQELSCQQVHNLLEEMKLIINNPLKVETAKILLAKEKLFRTILQVKRKYQQVNTVWAPLAFLYCNLAVCEKNDVPAIFISGRISKISVLKVAKHRIDSFLLFYEYVISSLMDLLTNEIGKGYRNIQPVQLRDTVFNLKAHLEYYTTGLPAQLSFELGFSKIMNLMDLYEQHWLEIDNLEKEKKAQTTLADYSSMNLKLAKIKYFTEAEILLLMYKNIEKSIIYWTFPHMGVYINAVKCLIKYMEKVFVPHAETSDELVVTAAERCIKIINILLLLLESNANDFNDLWIVDEFTYFPQKRYLYKWPGSNQKNESLERAAIKMLLQGEAVNFCAFVAFGPEGCDAMRFDKTLTIEINFEGIKKPTPGWCPTDTRKKEKRLQQILENFVMEMTHSGESWCRLGTDKYIIKHKPLKLMEIASSNWCRFHNETRRNLTHFQASPYTKWTLQLKPVPAGMRVCCKEKSEEMENSNADKDSAHSLGNGSTRIPDQVCNGSAPARIQASVHGSKGSKMNLGGVYKELIEFEEENYIALYLVGKAKFCRTEDVTNLKDGEKPETFGVKKLPCV